MYTPNLLSFGSMVAPSTAVSEGVWVKWLGHSTVLIHVHGTTILTDPVLHDGYGPSILGVSVGPRRIKPPAIEIHQLPPIDIVLLSHAHMDHMDMPTLTDLTQHSPETITLITAVNTKDVVHDLSWKKIVELDWCTKETVAGITFEGLQVKHNGWRWPGEPCRAEGYARTGRSYNGYFIDAGGCGIVFGGDTAYTVDFRNITKNVDLAMMPIGAYHPFPESHCTPEECVAMVQMMGAHRLLPIHHSTFRQSDEPCSEPIRRLRKAQTHNTWLTVEHQALGRAIQLV
jgi:L-ascorbate metabolism protein UlaG (beta-lactamase superfamily)